MRNSIKIFCIFIMWLTFSGVVMGFTIPPTNLINNSEIKNSIMLQKTCNVCKEVKPLSEFGGNKKFNDGLQYYCKICACKSRRKYAQTKNGLVSRIYSSQQNSSKQSNYPQPSYTKQELKDWLFSQEKFHQLYDAWKISGHYKMLSPSCDRKDDYKPYSLDNLQLMTWEENKQKGHNDTRNGINNKRSKAVVGINKKTGAVVEYYSMAEAKREIGINWGDLWRCCNGKQITGKGYYWKYKN